MCGEADIIFVMERAHRAKLQRRFGKHLKGKRVICLDSPAGEEGGAASQILLPLWEMVPPVGGG